MKAEQILTRMFLIMAGLAFVKIAAEAFSDPQHIMDYVNVTLGNIDSRSSIRSYYGGVNLFFGVFMLYGAFKMQKEALILLTLYCSGFAAGRIYGFFADGIPGSFVINWLIIETIFATIGITLLLRTTRISQKKLQFVKNDIG